MTQFDASVAFIITLTNILYLTAHLGAPAWGFREPGEQGSKQPGSREQGGEKAREQGAWELI